MNKLITFTGGKPTFNIDDIMWNDDAMRLALTEILSVRGDNWIVQGCEKSGANILAGYIMLDGELLQVEQHAHNSKTHFAKVTTYDAGGDVTFIDGTARQTWQKNRATLSATSGNLAFIGALSPMLYKTISIGAWNMDTTLSIDVAHGVTDALRRIKTVEVQIIGDAGTSIHNIFEGGYTSIAATNITIVRIAAGAFDASGYDDAAMNRGFMTIGYLATLTDV